MNNNPIKLENKELPEDKMKKYKVVYDNKNNKLSTEGFIDALFLSSIILTGFMWMFIALTIK